MDWAGPLWIGKIFNTPFIDLKLQENQHRAFRNSKKITKLLTLTRGEAEAPPMYHVLDRLSGKFRLPAPSVAAFFGALKEAGYLAVPTHFNSRGVRTDASASEMQRIMKSLTLKTQ
jgi:tRNA (guanine26-N2/guanine27-N2)-dimethyltransferase